MTKEIKIKENIFTKMFFFFKPIFFKQLLRECSAFFIFSAIVLIVFIIVLATTMDDTHSMWATIPLLFTMQIPIIVLLQYTLISSRMLVSKVDRGDLSYILCSNTSRTQVSSTAITFLLFTNFVNFLTVFIPTIIFVHNESLIPLIIFCIAYFTFCISLSGISVLFSAYCDKTVKYMIIVGGIFLISFVFTIIGYIGDTLDNVLKNFKYLSVIYFIGTNGFDKTDGIPNINWKMTMDCVVNIIVSVCTFIGAIVIFKNKDLLI